MAVVGNLYPTLADMAKRMDPDGSIAKVAEVLEKKNPILQDLPWFEGNLPTGHRFTSRVSLPSPTWRRFNEGINPAKGTTKQIDETCGILDGLSKVDVALADLNGNGPAVRAGMDDEFIAGYGEAVATALFYSNSKTDTAAIEGLTPRLNATSGNEAAAQIIKADASASSADQASIWLLGLSPDTVSGFFPHGSKAGLSYEDMGKQLVRDAANKEYRAYVTSWTWQLGLCVRDWRYAVRVCNIDTSNLTADCSAGADLSDLMQQAIDALWSTDGVQPVFYMNRTVKGMLRRQLLARKTETLMEKVQMPNGSRLDHYDGIPLRVCDALTNAEAIVS